MKTLRILIVFGVLALASALIADPPANQDPSTSSPWQRLMKKLENYVEPYMQRVDNGKSSNTPISEPAPSSSYSSYPSN